MNTRFAFLALALALGAALLAQPDPNQPAGQGGRGPGGRDAGRDAGGMNMFANMLGGGARRTRATAARGRSISCC
ncbi:MAG TPA: hypothetical protein PLZ36_16505, partial [Armatimonadota bacterium]|nr:hypothetical protein [Armatimonadota bacterium]